ncbi:MAG: dihydroorotate dehydrogenase electron transfer subunit [Planctomycetota bacterium]
MSHCNATTRPRGVFLAEVLANERLCQEHYRLILDLEHFPPTAPGQFVQLECRYPVQQVGARVVEWEPGEVPQFTQPEFRGSEALLRRPFSLAGRREHAHGRVELDIIYRTVGTGTHWLPRARPGDSLSVLGPLGNRFVFRRDRPAAALVGGGVGIPPMIYLAEVLAAAGKCPVAFAGARTARLLPLRLEPSVPVSKQGRPAPCVSEFSASGVPSAVATDDGSLGLHGFVHEAFEAWLDREGLGGEDVVVYSCGPEAMMRAVAGICEARGIECQLAMERKMACGMGTCQACILRVRDDNERGWSYRLCCSDGPVFDARDIVWD